MARYASRPWQKGDPVPEAGDVVLISGVHGDITSDQDRGYRERKVLTVTDDQEFIVLQTPGCWPTVERLENCWFADRRWPAVERLCDLFDAAPCGSPALDVEVWGLCCAKPMSPAPHKAGVKPPAFTTDINAAFWLLCYLFPGHDAGSVRSEITREALDEAENAFYTSKEDVEPFAEPFTRRFAMEIAHACVRSLIERADYLRDRP
ncbi:hypothetical protein CcrC1_gp421 [Caulobacter phage C1]|nr:hypothetical protein CcrC1_gp421 [Caulobacter phage C1]UTU08650.1 hypothetical protein CcrC2_gp422 [Caulobacter phage C2]UTU09164.1 hypothetical protein CcrJ4_gp416 [Caulobacter phage J4]UTU10282.1 hypothetical protein CcrRB23_gp420 [Caulobacter phage RB23]WGN97316.1 hypothetical protein [Bertelyvirus sp.]